MSRHIFIVVPAWVPTGPIKGAYALANALATDRDVTLVSLRGGAGANAPLDERVRQVSLENHRGFAAKVRAYRRLLREAGGRRSTASISICLAADAANTLCTRDSVTCASVRGNLQQNYRHDYGRIGPALAAGHLLCLRALDHVVVMTESMAGQVSRFTGRDPISIIGNFIDEAPLERFRAQESPVGPLRFVFLGSLTERKQPTLFVQEIARLRSRGIDARAQLIGEGPMREPLLRDIERRGLTAEVTLSGFLSEPYEVLSRSDVLVLPSLSEGLSRACMEALYLGVPCVMRAVDGNRELVRSGVSGALFDEDDQLGAAMMQAVQIARSGESNGCRVNLLPPAFRQGHAARAYLSLVES